MKQQNTGKLNQLHRLLPEGLVVDAAWLEARGYSSALRSRYVSHGWLEQVVRSLYRRPPGKLQAAREEEMLRWQHVVISLQTLMDRPLIVGGRTALELQGYAHYLSSAGPREIHLYADERPPGWLSKLDLESRFIFHSAKRLFREEPIARGLGALKWNLQTDRGVSADHRQDGSGCSLGIPELYRHDDEVDRTDLVRIGDDGGGAEADVAKLASDMQAGTQHGLSMSPASDKTHIVASTRQAGTKVAAHAPRSHHGDLHE